MLQATPFAPIASAVAGAGRRPPRIFLRSSGQTIHIGNIGRTPGVLARIEGHLPGLEVRRWSADIGYGRARMPRRHFPQLEIVQEGPGLRTALFEYDFLVHGSGPYLVAPDSIDRRRKESSPPP